MRTHFKDYNKTIVGRLRSREKVAIRNQQILQQAQEGKTGKMLAKRFKLTEDHIWEILRALKFQKPKREAKCYSCGKIFSRPGLSVRVITCCDECWKIE